MTYAEIDKMIKAKKATGATMPFTATNEIDENVIISEGEEEGLHFYETHTYQHNNWIRINIYWADGTVEEIYDR